MLKSATRSSISVSLSTTLHTDAQVILAIAPTLSLSLHELLMHRAMSKFSAPGPAGTIQEQHQTEDVQTLHCEVIMIWEREA